MCFLKNLPFIDSDTKNLHIIETFVETIFFVQCNTKVHVSYNCKERTLNQRQLIERMVGVFCLLQEVFKKQW